ncbi:hypothetical protein ABNB59_19960 [Paenibacillus larvae]|uniref:Uncharacterized protein n=1 Tax=Paenibacillus larvae TaxID=1464 RepID=A0AAP5N648_9BACL|nr:hypothetical protein [Paenibacillus larvae]AQR76870.1 hypothetical protein BXP28_05270 [Paenibacillus larvae subsp. larvae]MCY7478594.1 hypothetical protein [Paenibacillus larvae]MCY7491587.1 hypothetical protein [Paenibacillus larvae]MCY9563022.1 hypothetical protein [Paenibacillus larvae]MCY9569948.1 hypothetical protein [Paenibacillus larvae]
MKKKQESIVPIDIHDEVILVLHFAYILPMELCEPKRIYEVGGVRITIGYTVSYNLHEKPGYLQLVGGISQMSESLDV